jgi:hypothetical protein
MKFLLIATILLVPAAAFAQPSSLPGIPAAGPNRPVLLGGVVGPRRLGAHRGDMLSILDLGADQTGAVDSTAAFNAASNSNHDYWVPPGLYKIAGCLTFDMMGLRGPAIYQRTASGDVSLSGGAVLVFQSSTKTCPAQIVTTKGGVLLEGITFYWPEQNGSQASVATTVGADGAPSGATIIPVANASNIAVGALVFGTGIQAMTRVIAVGDNNITLEAKTSAALTSGSALTTWSPVSYPPLLANDARGQLVDLTFERNTVVNAFDFLTITAAGLGAGDWRIADNRIYAVHIAFNFQGSVHETTQVVDNMFTYGIFGSQTLTGNGYLSRWSNLNAEWVHVDPGNKANSSADGMTMTGNLVHGYRYGQRVVSGILNLFQGVLNLYDGVPTLLSVEGAAGYLGTQYGGNHVLGLFDPLGSGAPLNQFQFPGISLTQSGSVRGSFTDFNLGYSGGDVLDVLGSGPSIVSLRGGAIEDYGLGGAVDAWGVMCTNPAADVTISTTFKGTGTGNQDGVALSGCGHAAIVGNLFDGMKTPMLAYSGAQASIIGNTSRGTTSNASYVQFPANFASLKTTGNLWDKTGPTHVGWPASLAQAGVVQTISGSTKTQVVFASTAFDDTTSLSESTFTAPQAGYYQVSALVAQNGSGKDGDQWTLSVDQAGSQSISYARDYTMVATTAGAVEESALVYMAVGDTLKVNLTRMSGSGSWTVPADTTRSRFSVQQVQ